MNAMRKLLIDLKVLPEPSMRTPTLSASPEMIRGDVCFAVRMNKQGALSWEAYRGIGLHLTPAPATMSLPVVVPTWDRLTFR